MVDYNILKAFQNFDLSLIEVSVKHESEIQNTNVKIWLMADHKLKTIRRLNLLSKDSSGSVEERFFTDGYFKFNQDKGIFIAKYNAQSWDFERVVPSSVTKDILDFLPAIVSDLD